MAKDISLGGMFIASTFPAAFGVAVLIGLPLSRQRSSMLVSGTVRWTSQMGMGIQFGSLGASETRAIVEIARGYRSSVVWPRPS